MLKLIIFLSFFISSFILPSQSHAPFLFTMTALKSDRDVLLQQKERLDHDFLQRDFHIVAIGDSLTEGLGDLPNRGGYVGVVTRELQENLYIGEFNIQNLGIIGLRSDQLLEKVKGMEFQNSIKKADVVFLTIGGNDLVQVVQHHFFSLTVDDFQKERARYRDRLLETISSISEANKNVTIYVLGLFNPFFESLRELDEITSIISSWNDEIMVIAEKKDNVIYVPIDDLFMDDPNHLLYTDQFHPNEKGYEKIGNRVFSYFTMTQLQPSYREMVVEANQRR